MYAWIPKILNLLIILLFIISCGSDSVEDVIESYENGNKKVFVRYHPDSNVLEKHFYNISGEMIHLERDSLSYRDDLKQFMIGTWIIDKMTVDEEIMFEKDTVINLDSLPNIYTFTNKKLLISGPDYSADYDIEYLDSDSIIFEGKWSYGIEGEDTYRSERVYDIDHFQILSYYTLIWSEFFEDSEKEEEVIFRRIELPVSEVDIDSTSNIDTLLISQ